MIRLSRDDAALLAMLAQYEMVPLRVKKRLVDDLSKTAKPIGNVLIGRGRETSSGDVQKAAERLRSGARSNRESRPLTRYKRVSNRGVVKPSQVALSANRNEPRLRSGAHSSHIHKWARDSNLMRFLLVFHVRCCGNAVEQDKSFFID